MNTKQFDTYASRLMPLEEQIERKARMAARAAQAKLALRLYSIDNAAARQRGNGYPKIVDYVHDTWVDGPRELQATAYAISRLGELPAEKPKRKRNVSPEAKARNIARDRSRRQRMLA